MKARFMAKTAFGALALAFVTTLSGVANQAVLPVAVSATDQQTSAVEKFFIKKMADFVEASRKAGKLDMDELSKILNDAVKAGVSDRVMGIMLAMVAGAFPDYAPAIAAVAVRSYGSQITEAQVRNIIASVVNSLPRPYASVAPISEAVEKALGDSPVAKAVPSIAVTIADKTSDNPMTEVSQHHGLVTPYMEDSGGSLVLPGGLPIGTRPTGPDPVSSPSGN